MLTRAGALVESLFPELTADPAASPQVIRRCDAVEEIRRRRAEGTQDLSFGARPFILCGLPIRRLPAEVLKDTRRNGKFFLEIVGHPDHGGVPPVETTTTSRGRMVSTALSRLRRDQARHDKRPRK